jgi:hypothetical protein
MTKKEAEKEIESFLLEIKPCPFCGCVPEFDIRTDDEVSDHGSFGHYASRRACCKVVGVQTELFFTNNHKKPNYELWKGMAYFLIKGWNTRIKTNEQT